MYEILLVAYLVTLPFAVALTILTTKLVRPVGTHTVSAMRRAANGVLAVCSLLGVGTFALWVWSWRYFEIGTPQRVDAAIDIGGVATVVCLVPAVTVTCLALVLNRRASQREQKSLKADSASAPR